MSSNVEKLDSSESNRAAKQHTPPTPQAANTPPVYELENDGDSEMVNVDITDSSTVGWPEETSLRSQPDINNSDEGSYLFISRTSDTAPTLNTQVSSVHEFEILNAMDPSRHTNQSISQNLLSETKKDLSVKNSKRDRNKANHDKSRVRKGPQPVHSQAYGRASQSAMDLDPERSGSNSYSRDINRLQQELEHQRRGYQEQLEGMQRLIDNQDAHWAPQRTDGDIQSRASGLWGEVKTFAVQVCKTMKTPYSITDKLKDMLAEYEAEVKIVVPAFNKSAIEIFTEMKGSRRCRYFIQGWVHLTLWKYVFRSSQPSAGAAFKGVDAMDLWLPKNTSQAVIKLEQDIEHICSTSELGFEAFHKWRTLTLSILRVANTDGIIAMNQRSDVIEKRCQAMAEFLHELRLCGSNKTLSFGISTGEDSEELIKKLREGLVLIFEKATALSSILRTQRAGFEVRFPIVIPSRTQDTNPRLMLEPSWMEVDDDSDGEDSESLVENVIEPALFKSGTANGQDYGIQGCFMKATVTCVPRPRKQRVPQEFQTQMDEDESNLAF